MKSKKILLFVFLFLIISVLLISAFFLLNRTKVENVRVTNITSNSATITWETESSDIGTVLIKRNNTWTPLDGLLNSGEAYYDDRDIEYTEIGAVLGEEKK